MGDVLLATAGEDVCLWSMPNLTLHSVKNGDGNTTSCMCSNNGEMVAYSHKSNNISIAPLYGDASPITIETACEQSNVSFSRNSRFLVSGGKDCVVNIWDIRSQLARKTFKVHTDPISFCIFNFNGSVVASASTQGEITLTEIQSGLPCQPMVDAYPEAITCLTYSHFQRYILGSTSNSGAVALWDTKQGKLVKSFMEHNDAATCLTFSPLNDMLVGSTGMDKRVIFYDIQCKKIVKIINTGGPVTSCDFMHDGITVAIGSASGHVSTIDLRHGSIPLCIIKAHKTSVRSVSFQKVPKARQTARQAREIGSSSSSISDDREEFVERCLTDGNFDDKAIRKDYLAKLGERRPRSQPHLEGIKTGLSQVQGRNEQTEHVPGVVVHTSPIDIIKPIQSPANESHSSSLINPSSPARKPVKREKKRGSSSVIQDIVPLPQADSAFQYDDPVEPVERVDHDRLSTPSPLPHSSSTPSVLQHSFTPGSSRFLLKNQSSDNLFNKKNSDGLFLAYKRKGKSSNDLYTLKTSGEKEAKKGVKSSFSFKKSPFFSRKGSASRKNSAESDKSDIGSVTSTEKGSISELHLNRKCSSDLHSRFTGANQNIKETSAGLIRKSSSSLSDKTKAIAGLMNRSSSSLSENTKTISGSIRRSSSSLSENTRKGDQTPSAKETKHSRRRILSDNNQANNFDSPSNISTCSSDVFQYDDIPTPDISKDVIEPIITYQESIEKMILESMEDSRFAIHEDMVTLQVEMIRQMEIQRMQIEQMLEHYQYSCNELLKNVLGLPPR